MKKTLLSAAFLFAAFVGVNAQQTSFESSEGFNLGSIHGQNGWIVTDGSLGPVEFQEITNSNFSDGSQSLRIANDQLHGYQQNGPIIGAMYDMSLTELETISFDMYIDDIVGDASDYRFSTANMIDAVYTTTVYFSYDGTMVVQGATEFPELTTTWEPNTWFNVKIELTSTDIIYYIDDNIIYQGAASASQFTFDHMRFVHDNYSEGAAYIDNLKINDETVSRNDVLTSAFSIYPNPAKDVINISNATDAIENVTITDMNGRVVKQVVMGVNEGQINISDLSQGVYILNATSNGKSVTEKIVKK